MSTLEARKVSNLKEQAIIIFLLIAVLAMALLSAYSYLVKEPTVRPQDKEIEEYTKRVQMSPNDKNARLLLAFAYQEAGVYARAREQYKEALRIDAKDTAALYNLGLIEKAEKNYVLAEQYFKKVLAVKSTHVLGALGLAELSISQGRYDEAIKVLNKAIAVRGELVNLHLLKGKALEKKGDSGGALREYRLVLKYTPENKEAQAAIDRLQ